ncbi:hypothetical protein [Actinoplanes palleronii]|uniref:Uncharacterized protein n=1 Tax=Actinoplanes palleronii TaxID=113570 RepID=A0ABQ4BJA9_9ACTN|nr:hypothetical protein [Actinoplanes palleronii]GIE70757.1 hypothetical protein Apa02nite_068650 [Actinoplanes palleronii]
MPRIRSIRPEFWKSEAIACHDFFTRLAFIGLWNYVDDNGVGIDNWRLIAAELFPLEEDFAKVSRDLRESLASLADAGRITRYTVDGKRYFAVTNWSEHQKVDRPGKARYPAPESAGAAPTPPEGRENAPHPVPASGSPDEPSRESRETPSTGEGEKGRRGEGEKFCSPGVPVTNGRAGVIAMQETPDGTPGPAEQLVTAWISSCNRRPSRHVINDVGQLVAEMLQDDVPATDIERGIQLWQARGSNPRTLPSFVNQVMNAQPSNVVAIGGRLQQRPSTTDQRVGTALELAAKYAEEDLA